jgi:hypothetical protein
VEGGPVGAGEEGSSDLGVEGDAALQPARAGETQERRRRAQEVRRHQQIVDRSCACVSTIAMIDDDIHHASIDLPLDDRYIVDAWMLYC